MKPETKYNTNLTHRKHIQILILILVSLVITPVLHAQKEVESMSTDEIRKITQSELLEMPLEELMALVRRFKLSSLEELYEKVLNPEVKTASKFDEKYFESPLSISVITGDDIDASGALNVPEALRLIPGLIVRQKTNGNYDVHIRGNDNIPSGQTLFYSENSLTLVMIDERPVYNHFQGGTFWETLPVNMENIDRIEVVYGPSSALYGPNAVSGVIHIFTKRNNVEGLESHVQAQMGAEGSQDLQANIALGNSKFTARITANYQKLDRFQDDYFAFENYFDTVRKGRYVPSDSIKYFAPNTASKFPNPLRSSERKAANLFLYYQKAKDQGIAFSAGIQQSDIQSIFFDTREFSLTGRQSLSGYSNLKYYYKGLNFNASYNLGQQNLALGYPGYEFVYGNFQSSIEYLYKWKNLKVLPGISYQYVFYDDQRYLPEGESGIFSGRQDLGNTAVFIRFDYTLIEKLRLTAAGRWEWFKYPKDDYFSYQFTASYTIDEHSVVRGVYSKANRGPFMWDYHVNFSEISQYGNTTLETNYNKNLDLKLLEMHLFEFGFRSHLSKNVTADGSFFYNQTTNYNLPEGELYQINQNSYLLEVTKQNLPLVSKQMGASLSVETLVLKHIHAKLFGTLQMTNLDMVTSSYDLNDTLIVIINNDSKIHKATPKFTGGFNINYRGDSKISANTDVYFLSTQNVFTYDGMKKINSKAIVNLKIGYRFYGQHQVFVSGRNMLANDDYEFIFGDRVGAEFLLGVSLRWGKKK
ncbi:TonB-dependent receptor [Lentimicrobium sp. L6]|uniref:TonB-dependent receptor n=1 Tax=Lentimicrobium sp. L6 TaxID=2735916 RepID=UPI001555CC4B|nr:TonB-dependent receptor [Lentimicrobium sp. L6]NPD85859.1 TonB-dependent receptor [Lentimicrobium sp. L6]